MIFFDTSTLCLKCVSDDITSLISCFTYGSLLLWSETPESLEYSRELASFTEYLIAIFDESNFVCESWEMCEDLRLEGLDLLDHKKEK